MELKFGKRRAVVLNVKDEMSKFNFSPYEIKHLSFMTCFIEHSVP